MRRYAVLGCVLSMFIAFVSASPGAADEGVDFDLRRPDQTIVRVYFKSLKAARMIAASFEPLEAKYEKGYLLLQVTDEEYRQLLDLGLRTEVDYAAMDRYDALLKAGPVAGKAIPSFPCYRTVEETFTAAQALATNFPQLATWSDIGDSWDKAHGGGGYDMRVLKLSNAAIPGPKPKLLISAAIHAREYATAELALRFAESLVNGYGVDADATWLLDHHEAHFLFQANPDGRKKAEAGALWRKNTDQSYCGATSTSRGADLNRNFNFLWACCNGSSTDPCSDTYRGAAAGSEPETQALQSYDLSIFPDQRGPAMTDAAPASATGIFIDLHSSGKLLLWPWGMVTTVAPNGAALQTLGRKFAYFNGHAPSQSVGLYPTDGATDDFAYGTLGVAAYTFELGTQFFETCSYFENTLLPGNLPALKYALKVARTPYQTPAGPETLSPALSAGGASPGVPVGAAVTLSASVNDSRYNNTNGTEPSQAIAGAEYYLDTPPWTPGAVAVAMSATDGSFNATNEAVTATLNTAGLALGRHSLFLRGRDAAGNWGAMSAIFLYVQGGGGGGVDLTAAYDATLHAPRCSGAGRSCDSGAALLLGRGTLGPEPNRPNALGTCTDGASGTFHADESNDRLKVVSVDGSNLAAGKTVRIEATVWAWSTTSDKLDLYFTASASSPAWTFLATLSPPATGMQTLSATYTLPVGTLQAVRAQFRYQGAAGTCSAGAYNDRDDLIFSVP